MEREIGETFEYEGEKLKVIKAGTACDGCYFKGNHCDNRNYDITGICGWSRKDNQAVRFIKVTEEQQEEQQETEEIKERKIGETFEYQGIKLKVMKQVDGCSGCYFKGYSCRNNRIIGECIYCRRNDHTGVIFVDITDEPEENLQAEQPQQEVQQETEEPKEREIGDIFEYEGKKLKVVETTKNLCFDCYFWDGVNCQKTSRKCGECDEVKRTDYKSVIFVEVKDEQPQEEKPQELNLCEVLKYCPQGEPFWSPLYGDVKLYCIDQEAEKVVVTAVGNVHRNINSDGTATIYGVTSEEIMLYPSREQRDWSKVKYEPKNVLPRSWEEFCITHDITMSEYFIGETGNIFNSNSGKRIPEISKTILPSEQAAEAHLAYMQLHQLRNAWREGWLPDWTEDNQSKYAICSIDGEFSIRIRYTNRHFLAFQDEKRAYDFLACFIDLIRKAGDLI